MPPPTPSPAERFATLLLCLCQAVHTRSHWGLPLSLIALIIDRIRGINQRVASLAARIGAGDHLPRRFAPRRPPAAPRPRAPAKLPQKFGWLLPLVPDAVGYRSQLENLLRDPEMAALLAAAPASLSRPLRSLCWMLRLTPPDILARPPSARPKSRPPKPERPPTEKRPKKPEKVRYVFGLRYPPPFPDPA